MVRIAFMAFIAMSKNCTTTQRLILCALNEPQINNCAFQMLAVGRGR
jgi:hypothetical protein